MHVCIYTYICKVGMCIYVNKERKRELARVYFARRQMYVHLLKAVALVNILLCSPNAHQNHERIFSTHVSQVFSA